MPSLQDTYTAYMPAAFPGMRADTRADEVLSYSVETAAGLAFGSVAVQGAADRGCIAPDASNTSFVGIVVRDQALDAARSPNKVGQYETAALMRRGAVWVTVGEAVTPKDTPYFVPATGAIVKTASGNIAIPGGKFETTAASGALVRLRV